jgi:hypothetical protein
MISLIAQGLDGALTHFSDRSPEEPQPYLMLDARCETIRLDRLIRPQTVRVAIGLSSLQLVFPTDNRFELRQLHSLSGTYLGVLRFTETGSPAPMQLRRREGEVYNLQRIPSLGSPRQWHQPRRDCSGYRTGHLRAVLP